MARTKTSFTPATAPKGKGGSKHHKTRIKEAVGLANYQTLIEYIEGEGAARFIQALQGLDDKDYIVAYLKMLEFVKPKPQREAPAISKGISGYDVIVPGGEDIRHTVIFEDYSAGAIDYDKLSDAALEEIANARIRPDFNPPPLAFREEDVVP